MEKHYQWNELRQ